LPHSVCPNSQQASKTSARLPPEPKYNENRVFSPQQSHIGGYSGLLLQRVTRAISLLGGSIEYQWNFAAEQRIPAAYQSKNNGISADRENRRMWSLACDRYPGLTFLRQSSASSQI
jgi:hypothetical protein